MAAARNAGIAAARAPWVAFLDDDDVWSPRKLVAQLEAAARAGTSWVYSGAIAVAENGDVLYEYYFPEPAIVADQLRRSAVVPAGASNVVARTEVVRELGGFDEQLSMLADWDLWIRLSETDRPASLRDVHVAVLYHSGSGHAVTDQSAELGRLIRKHAARTPAVSIRPDVLGHGRWVASRAQPGRPSPEGCVALRARRVEAPKSHECAARTRCAARQADRLEDRVEAPAARRIVAGRCAAPWLVQAPYFRER